MNRLYIISNSIEAGARFGNITLSLSSPQFVVITGIDNLEAVSDRCIFIHDNMHPVESIKITELLLAKHGLNLKDENYLNKILLGIDQTLQSVNQMFDIYTDEWYTKKGGDQIRSLLESMGFTKDNGFEYAIGRNPQYRYYFIHAESPRMEVIINLFKGFINKRNNQIKESSIQINDPKGVFNQKSINYGW